jgi:hypothetical protein
MAAFPLSGWMTLLKPLPFTPALNGSTYAFYSIATDNVGNTKPPPPHADATTTILAGPVVIATAFDVTNDHVLLGQADLTFHPAKPGQHTPE